MNNFNLSINKISNVISHLEKHSNELNIALIKLFEATRIEISSFSCSKEITKLSVEVRNIFEIYLIIKHIYSDENGLKSWYGQIGKDFIDIMEGFKKLITDKNIKSEEIDDILKYANQTIKNSQYTLSNKI